MPNCINEISETREEIDRTAAEKWCCEFSRGGILPAERMQIIT